MSIFLILAFLFTVGSFLGWCLELVFRRITSKKFVNPGFLSGPWLPIYGFSLCVLYLLTLTESHIPIENKILQKIILFIIMAIVITCIEYIAGLIFIKKMKVKLWDYSENRGNIQGIICPTFSFFWLLLSAIYYFLIHPHILDMLRWLSNNLAFSFCIGFYFGIFTIDLINSFQVVFHIKKFAEEKQIVIRLEEFKSDVIESKKKRGEKIKFMLSYHSNVPLKESLEQYKKNRENLRKSSTRQKKKKTEKINKTK